MTDDICPCEECLKFPICKYLEVIKCEDLYNWILLVYVEEKDPRLSITKRLDHIEYLTKRHVNYINFNQVIFEKQIVLKGR